MPTIRTSLRAPLTAILILACTIPASAQWKDFIITLTHDTIFGDLKFSFSKPSKLETEDSSYRVDIRSVEYWCSISKRTLNRRVMLPGKKNYLFLPVLESGAISLYYNTISNGGNRISTTTYYAQKGDSAVVEVWTNGGGLLGGGDKARRQAMGALIADNPAVKKIFDNDTQYAPIDVQYYIHEYNMSTASPPANP
jgi:hypothetical protein